jgi:hypothetical protein
MDYRETVIGFATTILFVAASPVAAQTAALPAAKVDVAVKTSSEAAKTPVVVELVLKNVDGVPVNAKADTTIKLQVSKNTGDDKGPAAQVEAVIKAGHSSNRVEWMPPSAGIFRVNARQAEDRVLDGSAVFLVTPPAQETKAATPAEESKPARREKTKRARTSQGHGARHGFVWSGQRGACQTGPAAARATEARVRPHASSPQAELHVSVLGRDLDGIFADGKEAARINVIYFAPDGSAAPRPITIWFAWQGGEVKPQPLVIQAGKTTAEAEWTSHAPVKGSLKLSVSPKHDVIFDTGSTVSFVQPAARLAFSNPPDSLNFVEVATLNVMFLDANGSAMRNQTERFLAFAVGDTIVVPKPDKVPMPVGAIQAPTELSPNRFWGESTIEAFTDGYPPATHKIRVTWLGGLLLALIGGALGGLMRYVRSGGRVYVRVAVGVVMGTLAVLGFVAGIVHGPVPFPDLAKHSLLSVPVAALLGGWLGLALLDLMPLPKRRTPDNTADVTDDHPSPARSPDAGTVAETLSRAGGYSRIPPDGRDSLAGVAATELPVPGRADGRLV